MLPRYRVDDANKKALELPKIKKTRKKTTEQYIDELKKINNSIQVIGEYTGARDRIKVKCLKCQHIWEPQADSLVRKKSCRCPKCAGQCVSSNDFLKQFAITGYQDFIILGQYKNLTTKIKVCCKTCGYITYIEPHRLLNGVGCRICKNKENGLNSKRSTTQYKDELKRCHPNVEVLEEYINARTPILHKFPCGHLNKVSPDNLLRCNGFGCKICGSKKSRPPKTINQYKKELQNKNPKVEFIGDYVGARIKSKHKCKICGYVWMVSPSDILSGNGCPKCVGRDVTFQEFIEKFKKTGDKNIILTGKYINLTTKIDGYCNVCGYQISIEPYRLLKGVRCKKCMDQQNGLSKRKSHADFIKKVFLKNPNVEILGNYITSHDRIETKCLICGTVWKPIADSLLRGYGCPCCKSSKLESKVEYYLKSNNIEYVHPAKFDNLIGIGCRHLSYDFYLPQYNLLIECQGAQHKHPVEYFGGIKKFVVQKIHDTRKRKYAHDHNINLLEIWYYEENKIDKILTQILSILKSESLTTAG